MERRSFLKNLSLSLPALFLPKMMLGESKSGMLQLSQLKDIPLNTLVKVKVMGIGGAGTNMVNHMIKNRLPDIDFWTLDTDIHKENFSPNQMMIGMEHKSEWCAATNPVLGRLATEEKAGKISEILRQTDVLFIVVGLGAGTGSGGAPILAKTAHEMGILTIAIATIPFRFEGLRRYRNSQIAIEELLKNSDTSILIPFNRDFLDIACFSHDGNLEAAFKDALKAGDERVYQTILALSNLINNKGIVEIDFSDFSFMTKNSGIGFVGFGTGTGRSSGTMAAENALNLMPNKEWKPSKILVNITGGDDMTLLDINGAMNVIYDATGENSACDIVFGAAVNPQHHNQINLTVLTAGFNKNLKPPYLFS
jgi:cell division protein FtsZ